ncbi:DUF4179 domain-containing protein [Acutalibacter sp. 1XD8-33]|uniref:DUF4179 domain-containing protein n=1 Tax=Acutalibacter sp. 1XD8-33 TaxID=2320081 RepID=UPI000EA32071|nr:DUF4179 domain-containing protein [Acutalibacter sp. 1XD8-33]RKJ39209.1 DUF4179 domain-containing protein [Acutalibacter sp. 1XD8-33]
MKTSCNLFEGIGYIDPILIEEAGKPLKRKPVSLVWLKKAGVMAASFILASIVLLGINTAFPAFAEGLPLIGEAFRRINSLGANAATYDGLVRAVGVNGENGQYQVTVTEAYCDGEYVFFTLRLEAKDSRLLNMQSFFTEESAGNSNIPGWNVEINGEPGGTEFCDLPVFIRKGYYFESGPIKVKLSQKAEDGSTVQVGAVLGNLSGRTQEDIDRNERGRVVSIEPVKLQFQLTANAGYSESREAAGVSIDGLSLTGWSSSPSKFTATFSYPYLGAAGVSASARALDGTDLGGDIREFGDFGDGRYQFGDTAVQTCSFAGPPQEAKKVIVTVSSYGGEGVFGEFTIDLDTGEAAASTGYEEQGLPLLSIREYAEKTERAQAESSPAPAPSPKP